MKRLLDVADFERDVIDADEARFRGYVAASSRLVTASSPFRMAW
jgi:hypothetical protein